MWFIFLMYLWFYLAHLIKYWIYESSVELQATLDAAIGMLWNVKSKKDATVECVSEEKHLAVCSGKQWNHSSWIGIKKCKSWWLFVIHIVSYV